MLILLHFHAIQVLEYLKLYKGNATVVGRSSDLSLYSEEHVTFEEDDVYDQFDAEGFIKLNALRLKLLKKD